MSKVRIGDILEIPTAKGLAYAQYTHDDSMYGQLIRVLEKTFQRRPADFSETVQGPVQFCVFFPLKAAVRRGIFKIVGQQEVAPSNQVFPTFRSGLPDPQTNKVKTWWFWDGKEEWKVGEITEEQRKMPLSGTINDTLLIEYIETGWRPEKHSW
jgi:hypothetical protein